MSLQEKIIKYIDIPFSLTEKRPDVYQLHAPFYHEDGDMLDIFIEEIGDREIKISDFGMTLMRLSYAYEVDTPNKEKIFNKIISANKLNILNGKIFIETKIESFYPALMQFVQTVAKVSNMKLYQREIIHNLFFDELDELINIKLVKYLPEKNYCPLPELTEYQVDYCFNHREKPIYLFGVNNPSNAKLVTISCLKFQTEKINFRSAIVLESIDSIGRTDLKKLMSVADKEFPSFQDFKDNAENYFERESQKETK